MKILDGVELTGFIKERQAHQVRGLRQAQHVIPKLIVLQTTEKDSAELALLQEYAADILVEIEILTVQAEAAGAELKRLAQDTTVHGIVLLEGNLPEFSQKIAPVQDVGGTLEQSPFDAPMAVAVNWLLAAYNVQLPGKQLVVIGEGAALIAMWGSSGLTATHINTADEDPQVVLGADVIICAGPAQLRPEQVKQVVVLVDATPLGAPDVATPELRQRPDGMITPEQDKIGLLTICALLDNVIRAARLSVSKD